MALKDILEKLRNRAGKPGKDGEPRKWRRWILPALALLLILGTLFGDNGGFVEVEPGEVAVKYNNTGFALFGEGSTVIKEQGVISFMPLFQRVEKLDIRPQIFTMLGTDAEVKTTHRGSLGTTTTPNHNRTKRLTVRAADGSNFYFERVEIHYQVVPSMAGEVIRQNGRGDDYKWRAMRVHSRGILRDEFGKHSFIDISNPQNYAEAITTAKLALNKRLEDLGIEVTTILISKPKFDQRVETAIEDRQESEQEVEVQEEKRNKLRQQKGRRVQQVEQEKNAEYQQLLGELAAQKQQAQNALIAAKREADKYFIDREASGVAYRDEKITRAKANAVAYQRQAEGVVAQINAIGEQGPDVLNREIAEHVLPQLEKVSARPFSRPSTPIDIRHLDRAE